MALTIVNLDRVQKESPPLGEAVQKQQTFANQAATFKGTYSTTTTYSQGDVVLLGGVYYRSASNGNLNNKLTLTGFWTATGTAQKSAPTFIVPAQRQG